MTATNIHDELATRLNSYELFRHAMHVVADNPIGVCTTIGPGGVPRSRYMAAVIADPTFTRLYSLTGRYSRKLPDIALNPSVCWIFSAHWHQDVVTVPGRAVRLAGLQKLEGKWANLMAASELYGINAMSNKEETEFVGVETWVEHVEIISPRLRVYAPHEVAIFHTVPTYQNGEEIAMPKTSCCSCGSCSRSSTSTGENAD